MRLIFKDSDGDYFMANDGTILDHKKQPVTIETEANIRQAIRNLQHFEEQSAKANLDVGKSRFQPHPPYPGFPDAECPRCGASKQFPHRRWPQCNLCNPYNP